MSYIFQWGKAKWFLKVLIDLMEHIKCRYEIVVIRVLVVLAAIMDLIYFIEWDINEP